ncbi:MAG: RNA-binding protein [Candidatus Curtissbacteria bacterium]|nr:RNA-binding protein [Candidatus Curtissbacteria bacterium]
MAKRLFVGNLAYSVTSAQLEELFSQVGKISSLNLITDKFSGQSKGFAFLEMTTDDEANEAIKKFNGHEIDGRKMVVNEARPQENRDNRDRNYNKSKSW